MHFHESTRGDRSRLDRLSRNERNVHQRGRYRSVALAPNGRVTLNMADAVGGSRRFVQHWVYADRCGVIRAIAERHRPGRRSLLITIQRRDLAERVAREPAPGSGASAPRGRNVQGPDSEALRQEVLAQRRAPRAALLRVRAALAAATSSPRVDARGWAELRPARRCAPPERLQDPEP